MKNYEAVFILKAGTEDAVKGIIAAIGKILEKNSVKVAKEENWGKRENAYIIKKERDGIYYKLNFSADPKAIKHMDEAYKLNTDILRVTIVKKDVV